MTIRCALSCCLVVIVVFPFFYTFFTHFAQPCCYCCLCNFFVGFARNCTHLLHFYVIWWLYTVIAATFFTFIIATFVVAVSVIVNCCCSCCWSKSQTSILFTIPFICLIQTNCAAAVRARRARQITGVGEYA